VNRAGNFASSGLFSSHFGIESVCKFNMLPRNSLIKQSSEFLLSEQGEPAPEQGILDERAMARDHCFWRTAANESQPFSRIKCADWI
jgi:hypothetical protein